MDTLTLFVLIVLTAVWAVWCYSIAIRNGRDKYWAILMGLLFGLLAVIVYAIIGKTSQKRTEEIAEVVKKLNSQSNDKQ